MVEINLSAANPRKQNSVVNRGCGALFGLVFFAMGSAFTFFVAKEFLEKLDARGWEKVPATLTKAEVAIDKNGDPPFELKVAYDYSHQGAQYSSENYARSKTTDDDYEELALMAKDLRESGELIAHVNPENPSTAVLQPGSLWFGLMIFIPPIFVAIGGVILYASIRSWKKSKNSGVEAISSSPTAAQSNAGAWVGVVFGLVFLAVGIGTFYPMAVRPSALGQSAKSWPATPCEIVWAKIRTHKGDDSTTYSADIFYRYTFEGKQHHSNRYALLTGSSSNRKKHQQIVDRYLAEKSPICYVDPSLPERAVLKQKLGAGILLALVPIIATGIGAWILLFSRRSMREEKRATSSPFQPAADSAPGKTLSPGKSRIGAVIVLILVGLFWNGIVFGLLFPEAWLEGGEGGVFLKLFSIPFMLIGIGIACGLVYSLLALFNPKPILTIKPGEPLLGQEVSLALQIKGNARRLRRLRVILKGIEKATFQRGTDTVTVENIFYAETLADMTDPASMYQEDIVFTVPDDLMHSFDAGNNEIAWQLEVKGDRPRWPNIGDKFDILVHPPTYSS